VKILGEIVAFETFPFLEEFAEDQIPHCGEYGKFEC
jgi:hypothetical protein